MESELTSSQSLAAFNHLDTTVSQKKPNCYDQYGITQPVHNIYQVESAA